MATTWGQALAVASQLAGARLPNTQMSLLIFAETIHEQIDFTAGQPAVAKRLGQLRSDRKYAATSLRGRTALYAALLVGVRVLDNPTSADILYLVSEGGDTASHISFDELARQITSLGVRLFVSGVYDALGYRSRTPEELSGPTNLSDLVKRTGGELIVPFGSGFPVSAKEMNQFSLMLNTYHLRLIEDYLLEVEFSEPADKRRSWELKLSKTKRGQWKNSTITYPTELTGCATSPSSPAS